MRDHRTITIEDLELGKIRYSFEATVYFSEYTEAQTWDYPGYHTIEIEYTELESDIYAWDAELEEEYTVTDKKEIEMVLDWVDWEGQLEKYL